MFMGCEFGQWNEWNHDTSLDWHLLDWQSHSGLQRWVRDLNTFYRGEPAAHQLDCDGAGFSWVDCDDHQASVISFLRKRYRPGAEGEPHGEPEATLLYVCNFTPVPRYGYRVGAPCAGRWDEVLNSDAPLYGGSGIGNAGGVEAQKVPFHNQPCSLEITLPPLAVLVFRKA